MGAHFLARKIAQALVDEKFSVLLIDTNSANVREARSQGIPAVTANAFSPLVSDDLNLGGIGRFFALTPNEDVNTLATIHFFGIIWSLWDLSNCSFIR